MEWDEICIRVDRDRDARREMEDGKSSQEGGGEEGRTNQPKVLQIIGLLDAHHYPTPLSTLANSLSRLLPRSSSKSHSHSNQPLQRQTSTHRNKSQISLSSLLKTLFTWSITNDRVGVDRVYIVVGLVVMILETTGRDEDDDEDEDEQDVIEVFIDWIDSLSTKLSSSEFSARNGVSNDEMTEVDVARKAEAEEAKFLLAELIRRRAIRYEVYLQSMIARGETEAIPSHPVSRYSNSFII
jgi:hypothetical protein